MSVADKKWWQGGPDIAMKDGCSRQGSDNDEIGGGGGKDGLVATMIG